MTIVEADIAAQKLVEKLNDLRWSFEDCFREDLWTRNYDQLIARVREIQEVDDELDRMIIRGHELRAQENH